jgi:hypothetical protein
MQLRTLAIVFVCIAVLVAVGVGFWLTFVAHSRNGSANRRLRLLTIRSYSVGAVIAAVFFAGFTGIFLVITMFLQVPNLTKPDIAAAIAKRPVSAELTIWLLTFS